MRHVNYLNCYHYRPNQHARMYRQAAAIVKAALLAWVGYVLAVLVLNL